MEIALSLEQRFGLRKLADSLEGMSEAELKALVLDTTEELLLEREYYLSLMRGAGIQIETCKPFDIALPETEEEMIEVFGEIPSDDRLSDYINERILQHMEAARMDIDIEAIALGAEDQ